MTQYTKTMSWINFKKLLPCMYDKWVFSFTELAKQVWVTRQCFCTAFTAFKRGKNVKMQKGTLEKIAKALSIDIQQIAL